MAKSRKNPFDIIMPKEKKPKKSDAEFARQLKDSIEKQGNIDALDVLLNNVMSPVWSGNTTNQKEVSMTSKDTNNKIRFNDKIINAGISGNLLAFTVRQWVSEQEIRMEKANLIPNNDDIGSMFSYMAGQEPIKWGQGLNVYSAKIGAIGKAPNLQSRYDYFLSQEMNETYRCLTGDIDYKSLIDACHKQPGLVNILTSNLNFYRSYLDGVTNVPMSDNFIEKSELYGEQEKRIHKMCEILFQTFQMTIYMPSRVKNIVSQITTENDINIDLVASSAERLVIKKNNSSSQENTLNIYEKMNNLNPGISSKRVFGKTNHSFQRSSSGKLIKQLGIQGLLDQAVIDRTINNDYSFTEYYLNMLTQPNNQLITTETITSAGRTVINTKNNIKKFSTMALDIIVIDNIVYTSSDSIPLDLLAEGSQTNVNIKSKDQVHSYIEKLFATDNYGYIPSEALTSEDEMVRLQTSVYNSTILGDVYSEILEKESRVSDRLNKILSNFPDTKEDFFNSQQYCEEIINGKNVLDKLIFNSLNMPEYIPQNKIMEVFSTDVNVPTKANGIFNTTAHNKNMARQVVLNFNIVQTATGTSLNKFLYNKDITTTLDMEKECISISKELIKDLLSETCNKEYIRILLDEISENDDLKDKKGLDRQSLHSFIKSKYLNNMNNIAKITHLLYLFDIVRDMTTYHMTRLLNATNLHPLGILITTTNQEGDKYYTKNNLLYHSFNGLNYLDANLMIKDQHSNLSNSRTNLLTTGLFGEILIKSATHGYKLGNAELKRLDEMSCWDISSGGIKTGSAERYSKSYYPINTLLSELVIGPRINNRDKVSETYASAVKVLGEPSVTSYSPTRSTPNLNSLPYTHLLLSDENINTEIKNSDTKASDQITNTDKIVVNTDRMYSNKYLRHGDETADKMYYRFSKDFKSRYIDEGIADESMHDYQTIPFINKDTVNRIADRFGSFETTFVCVLLDLVKEIDDMILTSDKNKRDSILDKIFDGSFVDKIKTTSTILTGEDKLEDNKGLANATVYIPTMDELILHILSKDTYFK